jgi:hypothetical protein
MIVETYFAFFVGITTTVGCFERACHRLTLSEGQQVIIQKFLWITDACNREKKSKKLFILR